MRAMISVLLPCIALGACAPQVPASNPGPGFGDYASYQGQQGAPLGTAPGMAADRDRTAGVQASPSHAGISDEQSFAAVTARETIETDAARRAEQAAAYEVVQPGQLPTRSGQGGPNIVAFALRTTNAVGQQVYERGYTRPARYQRACGAHASDDAAQRAFLAGGGPERNVDGMDPDGDGFACAWDPTPFRSAARAAQAAPAVVQDRPLGQ